MYLLFFVRKISFSKLKSVSLFRFPVVASPPIENIHSTGAVDAGVDSRSNARRERRGYISFFSCQKLKQSSSDIAHLLNSSFTCIYFYFSNKMLVFTCIKLRNIIYFRKFNSCIIGKKMSIIMYQETES